ncbi:MAG: hypothetical protein RDV41_15680, partial [Planctomycetota bacterium]|nr:hypothetical protein [Planctomycetota bacterium]
DLELGAGVELEVETAKEPAPSIKKTVKDYLPDLKSADEAARLAAVQGLLTMGTEPACDALVRRWPSEKKGTPVYEAIRDALPNFKARDVAGELGMLVDSKSSSDEMLLDGVSILERLGGADSAATLAKFLNCNRPMVSLSAAGALRSLGDLSVPHVAVLMKSDSRRGDAIRLLTEIGTEKSAAVLAGYLDRDHKVTPVGQAVVDALKTIGKPAVPGLIVQLDDPGRKLWAAEVLRLITEQPYGSADKGKWIEWWRLNKDK